MSKASEVKVTRCWICGEPVNAWEGDESRWIKTPRGPVHWVCFVGVPDRSVPVGGGGP